MKMIMTALAAAMLVASPVVLSDAAKAGHKRHHWAKHHRHFVKHHRWARRHHGRIVVRVGYGARYGYADCCGCW